MERLIDGLFFIVLSCLAISIGYGAFYEQFLLLTLEMQTSVTISYVVIYGCIYILTRFVSKDLRFKGMLFSSRETLNHAVKDDDRKFPLIVFCLTVLLAGVWMDGVPRYISEFDWEKAPWLFFPGILIFLIGIGLLWVVLTTLVFLIIKRVCINIQLSVVFRLLGYTFVHLVILFFLLNATLIFPSQGFEIINIITSTLRVDILTLSIVMILLQSVLSVILVVRCFPKPSGLV